LQFAARQRALKKAEKKRIRQQEMELALKMSMQADEVVEDACEEEGKLASIPMIEVGEFNDKVKTVVGKVVDSLIKGIRESCLSVEVDTALSLIRVALVGQP